MGILAIVLLLSFISVFTCLFFLFKKTFAYKAPTSSIKFWLSTFILTPVILVGSVYAYLYFSSRYQDKTFDRTGWMVDKEERYVYQHDLLDSEILLKLNKAQVQDLLGEAELYEDQTIRYYMGYDPKIYFNLAPDWLVIEMEKDTVVNYYIER